MSNSTQPVVTPDDFSSIPSVISWFVAVTATLCILAKMATKWSMTRVFAMDDVFILLSLMFSIGMVVSVSVESANGLGKREANLSDVQLLRFQKSAYAGDLMFIFTLFFSKSSVLFLLNALGRASSDRVLIYVTGGVLGVWSVTSVFVSAFQCPFPHPWAVLGSKCVNQFSFWAYFDVLNIISELFLIVVPYIIMAKVQIPMGKKVAVIIVFALRIFVIAAIAVELYFRQQVKQSTDPTFALWPVVVSSLFVQCLSIIFSCVPYLRPFFSSLESGMIRIDDTRRRGGTTVGGRYYGKKNSSGNSGNDSTKLKNLSLREWPKATTQTGITATERGKGDDERGSMTSTSNIIRATTSFTVHSEEVSGI